MFDNLFGGLDISKMINDALRQNQFFSGGLLLGLLGLIGASLRNVPMAIWERFKRTFQYVTYIDNTNDMYKALAEWLLDNHPKSFRRVEARLKEEHRNGKTNYLLKIRQFTDFNFIRRGAWYVFVKKDKEKLENASSIHTRFIESYTISSIFGERVIKKMMDDVVAEFTKKANTKRGLRVVVTDKWAEGRNKYLPVYKKLDQVFFDGKEDILADIENFLSKEKFYLDNGIKFKRGYLLYGPPGTGKTTFVFAIAAWLDWPVYYLNPKGFSDDSSFEDFVAEVNDESIILIEDVDVFWTNRKEKGESKVSFQSLLNVLDGLHSPNKVLIMMTTNKQEEFDEAFLRKGRLDKKVEVGYARKEHVEKMLEQFYDKENVVLEKYDVELPMVDIQDVIIKHDFETAKQILENANDI